VADQAGVREDAQVHRDGRSTDRQAAGEVADGARAGGEVLEDAAPGGVTQRAQAPLSFVNLH
jgi:hypothetical protein